MKQPKKTAKIPPMSCVRFMPRISPARLFPTLVRKGFVVRLFDWVRCGISILTFHAPGRSDQTWVRPENRWPSDFHPSRIVTAARAAGSNMYARLRWRCASSCQGTVFVSLSNGAHTAPWKCVCALCASDSQVRGRVSIQSTISLRSEKNHRPSFLKVSRYRMEATIMLLFPSATET